MGKHPIRLFTTLTIETNSLKKLVVLFFFLLGWVSITHGQDSVSKPSLYYSDSARDVILDLYDQKLSSLEISFQEQDIQTTYGKTHVVIAGDTNLPPVILVHGINSGIPTSLELIKNLSVKYCIYGVDILGQPNKSEDVRLPFYDSSYALWMMEVMDAIQMEKATFIGVSYGSYMVQRLMVYQPSKIEKAIFIVPAGIVTTPALKSIFKVFRPLNKFKNEGDEQDLMDFMDAVYTFPDSHSIAQQKAVVQGFKVDNRLPPMITAESAKNYRGPVYVIAADKDILFPAQPMQGEVKKIFKGLREFHVLKNCKHVPGPDQMHVIHGLVENWLAEGIQK